MPTYQIFYDYYNYIDIYSYINKNYVSPSHGIFWCNLTWGSANGSILNININNKTYIIRAGNYIGQSSTFLVKKGEVIKMVCSNYGTAAEWIIRLIPSFNN